MGLFKKNIIVIIFIVFDILSLVVAHNLSYTILSKYQNEWSSFFVYSQKSYLWINLIIVFFLLYENIYYQRFDFWRETRKVFKAIFYAFISVLTILSLLKTINDYSRSYLLLFFLLLLIIIPIMKRSVKKLLFKIDFFKERVKIIAKQKQKYIFINELENNWYFGYKPVCNNFQNLIVYSEGFSLEELSFILKKYSAQTNNIYLVPYINDFDLSNTEIVDFFNIRLSAFRIQNHLLSYKNLFIKALFEKFLILLLFPLVLILHLFLFLFIKYESKGKVIFKQKRLGKNGKLFSCYKYRTMYESNDEILTEYLNKNPKEKLYFDKYHKLKYDPRITKVGKILRKASLDEFPQFYNILRGDMNLIGPRPYMISEEEKIEKENLNIILQVKPGITGFWQVNGRSNLSFSQRVKLDIWYINNWSLWIDFVIFLKTIKVVLFRDGAH